MTDKGEHGRGVRVAAMSFLAPEEFPVLLNVVIGSQAHGLARPDSDYDYREIFYVPTREILQVPRRNRPKHEWDSQTRMDDDLAGWEVEKFLDLVMLGHPNAIELLWAPYAIDFEPTEDAESLRALAPSLLSAREVRRSTLGYAQNCINKLIKGNQPERADKWKVTYLRILNQFAILLETGTLPIEVPRAGWGYEIHRARLGKLSVGEVIDMGIDLEQRMRDAGKTGCPFADEPDGIAINEWLMDFRQRHWED